MAFTLCCHGIMRMGRNDKLLGKVIFSIPALGKAPLEIGHVGMPNSPCCKNNVSNSFQGALLFLVACCRHHVVFVLFDEGDPAMVTCTPALFYVETNKKLVQDRLDPKVLA